MQVCGYNCKYKMAQSFNKLFVYTGVEEKVQHNEIIYKGVKLHKAFPYEFIPGNEELCACVNMVYNTVYLFTPTRNSKAVSVQDWITSNGLRRTDTVNHLHQNVYMSCH